MSGAWGGVAVLNPLCVCGRVPHERDCPVGVIADVLYRYFGPVTGVPIRNAATDEITEGLSRVMRVRPPNEGQ